MKRIDDIIHWKLMEIIFLIFVVLISFPLWENLKIDEAMTAAAFSDDVRYTYLSVEGRKLESMYPLKNEEAIQKLKPIRLRLTNNTKIKEDYTIIIKIKKDSTMDYRCLNIAFDEKVNRLEDLYFSDDDDNFYFILKTDTIRGEIKEYNVLIWMDVSSDPEMASKTLHYSFELQ